MCDEKACGQQSFAVGVSGGADSLALVYLLREWALRCGKKIVALTVDHQLRPTSRQEADYVAKLMRQAGIEHHILTWEGEKPVSGIETAAREARYRLLEDWCLSNGIYTIFMAHHKRDQAETFFYPAAAGQRSGWFVRDCSGEQRRQIDGFAAIVGYCTGGSERLS